MGGKPLRNLLCCYHPKTDDIRDDLRPISGCYGQTYNIEQINSKQNIDLLKTKKTKKCTYKRIESPQPVEVSNFKLNGTQLLPFLIDIKVQMPVHILCKFRN
uniref:Uncharacterized protein n=1 Tax=Onchocerca volvulus TaxID=6282 RepID=A0A8R1Y5G3_ONCVO